MELSFGQRKNVKSERVILVPGPVSETETVRRIYDLFVVRKLSMKAIARLLNADGLPGVTGALWTALAVKGLLTNEKYIGNSVYNRTSKKFSVNYRHNPECEWVRKVGAYEPVVSVSLFERAKQQFKDNADRYSDSAMLDYLSAVWCREKTLSRDIVDASVAPSTNCYKKHFGSLSAAYKRIGFASARHANYQALSDIRQRICGEIVERVSAGGGIISRPPGMNCQLEINNELCVSVVVGRTSPTGASRNQNTGASATAPRKSRTFLSLPALMPDGPR